MAGGFGVGDGWGRLRRVLVRRPSPDLAAAEADRWGYGGQPAADQALEEHAALLAALRSAGAEVVEHPAPQPGRPDAMFVFDPVLMTRRGAVVLRMGKTLRRGEEEALASRLEELGVPILGRLREPATAEGGDLLWLDRHTLAVGQGFRTNPEGVLQLQEILAPQGIELLPVALPYHAGPRHCLHLMSLISMLDEDLAVAHLPLLPVPFWRLLLERGIRLAEVPAQDLPTLGPNVLALAPRHVLMLAGNPITQGQLEAAGCQVTLVSGEELCWKTEGGPTCLTLPLARD